MLRLEVTHYYTQRNVQTDVWLGVSCCEQFPSPSQDMFADEEIYRISTSPPQRKTNSALSENANLQECQEEQILPPGCNFVKLVLTVVLGQCK